MMDVQPKSIDNRAHDEFLILLSVLRATTFAAAVTVVPEDWTFGIISYGGVERENRCSAFLGPASVMEDEDSAHYLIHSGGPHPGRGKTRLEAVQDAARWSLNKWPYRKIACPDRAGPFGKDEVDAAVRELLEGVG